MSVHEHAEYVASNGDMFKRDREHIERGTLSREPDQLRGDRRHLPRREVSICRLLFDLDAL